ncbi:cytochrome P450 6a2-like, partial [Manduca sexta]
MWISVYLVVIILLLILLLAVFHYTSKGRKYWLRRNVPYREPCPIFGNFGATFTMRRSYTKMLQYFYDKYRHERYVGIFQARRPTLMLIDLDTVKNVLSKEFANFSDRVSVSTDTQREPLLRNLANMSGAEWKAMRQIVTPTFSSAKMKAMFPLIADCANTLKNILHEESLDELDVPSIMTRFTTDVIGSCAFGVDPGSLKDVD